MTILEQAFQIQADFLHRPTIVKTAMIPGGHAQRLLHDLSIVNPFGEEHAYFHDDTNNVHSRAKLLKCFTGERGIICGESALWVWEGGDFPSTIEMIAEQGLQFAMHSRNVQTYRRSIMEEHIIDVLGLWITSPARTVFDCINYGTEDEWNNARVHCSEMIWNYGVNIGEIRELLKSNHNSGGHCCGIRRLHELMIMLGTLLSIQRAEHREDAQQLDIMLAQYASEMEFAESKIVGTDYGDDEIHMQDELLNDDSGDTIMATAMCHNEREQELIAI